MGLSDFFSGSVEEMPRPEIMETPWAPQARNFLTRLMNANVQLPTRQVAGMSGAEQQGQSILGNILGGGAFADPRTSPLYAGLRRESMAEEERAANALQRRQQGAGMYNSSTAAGAEGRMRGDFANRRQSLLGSLYESERARDNPYTRLAASAQFGALPRQLEQAGNDAAYQQQMGTTLFPYQQQAALAGQLLNYQPWYQPQVYSEPSMFSQLAGPIGGLMGGAGGLMGGLGAMGLGGILGKQTPGAGMGGSLAADWGPGMMR